jgi:hypothetical protein
MHVGSGASKAFKRVLYVFFLIKNETIINNTNGPKLVPIELGAKDPAIGLHPHGLRIGRCTHELPGYTDHAWPMLQPTYV